MSCSKSHFRIYKPPFEVLGTICSVRWHADTLFFGLPCQFDADKPLYDMGFAKRVTDVCRALKIRHRTFFSKSRLHGCLALVARMESLHSWACS